LIDALILSILNNRYRFCRIKTGDTAPENQKSADAIDPNAIKSRPPAVRAGLDSDLLMPARMPEEYLKPNTAQPRRNRLVLRKKYQPLHCNVVINNLNSFCIR